MTLTCLLRGHDWWITTFKTLKRDMWGSWDEKAYLCARCGRLKR